MLSLKIKRIYRVVYEELRRFFWLPSALFILFLKISKKGRKIKFCTIWYARIGHLAANTELFLRRRNAGLIERENKYIGVGGKPCNRQLLNMFKREMPIIENKFLSGVIKTKLFQKSDFFQDMPCSFNEYYEFNDLPQAINFTHEEEKRGIKELEKMGIGPNDWFVCFQNRDSAYLNRRFKSVDWSRHDYRDCKISNFIPAMEYIASRGGYAIRIGHYVDEKLRVEDNPRIIDYATNYRSDFMDIYLSSHCKFFVGNTAGLFLVPSIIGPPIILTNLVVLEIPPLRKRDLFIPKKIKELKENRLLTFPEIFKRRIGTWDHNELFFWGGLDLIENTPDEILAIVIEMNSILDETYKYTNEDNLMQKKYRSLLKPHHYCYGNPARIGREFLIQNKDLLEL